jgi:hypothetical protein
MRTGEVDRGRRSLARYHDGVLLGGQFVGGVLTSSSPPSVTKLNHRQKRKNASTCLEGEREPGEGEGER